MMIQQRKWAGLLQSGSAADQVTALRQMSNEQYIEGFAVTVTRLAGSSDDEVRMWAAEALETVIRPTAEDVRSLAEMLGTADDGEIVYWAATLLGRLAGQAEAAVDALESCVRTSHYLPAREQATWALCQIGPPALSAADTLKKTASDAPPRLRRMATAALQAIGDAA
jgi:HEAT repeat protein